MRVRISVNALTEELRHIRFSVHAEPDRARIEAAGYRCEIGHSVLSRNDRRRSDETLLERFCAAYIRATSKPQLTRVDVHMKNGMAKPMMQRRAARTAATARITSCARCSRDHCAGACAGRSERCSRHPPTRSGDAHVRPHCRRAANATRSSRNMTGMQTRLRPRCIATQDPAFYNNTIRNMATPWTNRDQIGVRCLSMITPPRWSAWCATMFPSTPCSAPISCTSPMRAVGCAGVFDPPTTTCTRRWTPTTSI